MDDRWDKRIGRWFAMTNEERLLVLAVVAILMIGFAAREWHLRRLAAKPYAPPGNELTP